MPRVRLLTDEDINGAILTGLRLHHPDIDVVGAREVRLARAPDPRVLDWAAANFRAVVSHDVKTMPPAARSRLAMGKPLPGLIIVPQWYPVGHAIRDIAALVERSEIESLDGRIAHVPLNKTWRVSEEAAVWAVTALIEQLRT